MAGSVARSGGTRAALTATRLDQSLMSASALNDATLRMPTMFIRAQSNRLLPNEAGGHRRFFSSSPLLVASTYPAIAAPKQGKPARTDCKVIWSGDQIG